MDTALKLMKVLALLSVAFACSAIGVEVLRVRPVVAELDATLKSASREIDALQGTTTKIDAVVVGVDRTIKELDYPIIQAGLTSKKEAAMLDEWNAEITHTLGNVDDTVIVLDGSAKAITSETVATMRTVNATVANVNPTLDETATTLKAAQVTLGDTNKLLVDPSITATLANTRDATKHLSDTAGDVQVAVHSYLHPGWKTKVFNWSATVVHALGGWF